MNTAAAARAVARVPARLATDGFSPWPVVTVLQTEQRASVVARRPLPGLISARPTECGVVGMAAASITRPCGSPITLVDTALELGAELPASIRAHRFDMRVYMSPETADRIIEMAPNADSLVLVGVGVVGPTVEPAPTWVRASDGSLDPVVVVWWRGDTRASPG